MVAVAEEAFDRGHGLARHRALVVDEGWRSGGISAELIARIMENCFYELDAPVARVCTAERNNFV